STSDSIIECIGNTPMVRLSRLGRPKNHTLLAKCEFMNPGGSVKDRIALHMVERAEAEGHLKPGQLMIEATGGNTGIGLALVARLKGYRLLCVMTEKVGKEKVRNMEVMGAEVLVVPGGKSIGDPAHFINQAKRIAKEQNGWFVGQFENQDNLDAHYRFTGPEIWQQTEGKVDTLVAGIGTGGTLLGAGKFLREQKPSVKLVLADPAGSMLADWVDGSEPNGRSYLVEGIGSDFIPGIVDLKKIDRAIRVDDQTSIRTTHELLKKESLFVSGSAGCAVSAAIQYCEELPEGATVVVVLPGSGRLYMSTIFNPTWLEEKGLEPD
ncbi:MAG: cysteine synthase family protein, partial [Cyanobacteria bacterium]|nr:cysteine synthase family protein [Cyanobacteriota bacterium]